MYKRQFIETEHKTVTYTLGEQNMLSMVAESKTPYGLSLIHILLEAFDLYSELYKEGCFHPDTASLTAPEARKLFGEGKAAFIVQGLSLIHI